jgi:hypothetical protein
MRTKLLGATALWLLALPAVAEPAFQLGRQGAAMAQPIDFDLLKQAEQQSKSDQAAEDAKKAAAEKAAADKAAEDAAKQAQADKAAADKAAAEKAAADKARANPASPPEPPPEVRTTHVPFRLATGAAAGSAALTETPGGLHFLLGFANVPPGKYRLLVLQRAGCGKPFAAPPGPPQPIPVVTAGADGGIAAAFTVRQLSLGDAGGPVLALYPADDPKQAGAVWAACGAVAR